MLSSLTNLVQQLEQNDSNHEMLLLSIRFHFQFARFTKYAIETLISLIAYFIGTTKTIVNMIPTVSEYNQTGARTTKFHREQIIVCPTSNANDNISLLSNER